jgi:hypothetical protein
MDTDGDEDELRESTGIQRQFVQIREIRVTAPVLSV